MCALGNRPLSRDHYPCETCDHKYPACHDECAAMQTALAARKRRMQIERRNRRAESDVAAMMVRKADAARKRR